MNATFVIIAATPFNGSYPSLFSREHFAAVASVAHALTAIVPANVGFTVAPTCGGGGGWDLEPGVTVTFAGCDVQHERDLRSCAEAIRRALAQQAVCFIRRDEAFELVEAIEAPAAEPTAAAA